MKTRGIILIALLVFASSGCISVEDGKVTIDFSHFAKGDNSNITTEEENTQKTTNTKTSGETVSNAESLNMSIVEWKKALIFDLIDLKEQGGNLTSLQYKNSKSKILSKYMNKKVRWVGTVIDVYYDDWGKVAIRVMLHEKANLVVETQDKTHWINFEETLSFVPTDPEVALHLSKGDKIELEILIEDANYCPFVETCRYDLEVISFKKIEGGK